MLFEADRHEPLRKSTWDETRARETIARIVAEAERAFDPETLWPMHPLDGLSVSELIRHSLYLGAAGVIWAIDHLSEQGVVQRQRDWAPIAARLCERSPASRDRQAPLREGFMLGRAGGALAAHRVTRDARSLREGLEAARANLLHESNEISVGTPGTLLVAAALFQQSGDPNLGEIVRQSAERVHAELKFAPEHGCAVWTQSYFGPPAVYVGFGHGFVGNVCALIGAGFPGALEAEVERTLDATVLVENGLANWPQTVGPQQPGRTAPLVQICHGAPGVVVALARLEPRQGSRLEDLLRMGGELTWHAGPLAKGSGLCHGTAGNGYAFLCLYRRSGERVWLERARAFAMHAIGQWEAEQERYGRGRFSLWTGDLGLACFLWDCVRERDAFPTLHAF